MVQDNTSLYERLLQDNENRVKLDKGDVINNEKVVIGYYEYAVRLGICTNTLLNFYLYLYWYLRDENILENVLVLFESDIRLISRDLKDLTTYSLKSISNCAEITGKINIDKYVLKRQLVVQEKYLSKKEVIVLLKDIIKKRENEYKIQLSSDVNYFLWTLRNRQVRCIDKLDRYIIDGYTDTPPYVHVNDIFVTEQELRDYTAEQLFEQSLKNV